MAGQSRTASFDLDDKQFKAALEVATKELEFRGRRSLDNLAYNVQNRAKEYAPVGPPRDDGTKKLKDSIKANVPGVVEGSTYTVTIEASAPHSSLVEFGTAPHIIRVKKAQVLSDGQQFFGRQVNHPGTTAQPFMRPALLEAIQEWTIRFGGPKR